MGAHQFAQMRALHCHQNIPGDHRLQLSDQDKRLSECASSALTTLLAGLFNFPVDLFVQAAVIWLRPD
jgi:hypothetical protein